jgi:hypothetical protein
MKKQLIIIGIIVILLTVGLSGCNEKNNSVQSDEEKFIGIWIYSFTFEGITATVTYNFFSNKTLKIVGSMGGAEQPMSGTWNIKNNTIVLASSGDEIITGEYSFSNNYKTVTITPSSGDSLVLRKKYF